MKSLTHGSSRMSSALNNKRGIRPLLFVFLSVLITLPAQSQVLFTYGKKAVTAQEFLKAYRKNNTDSIASSLNYDEYLELYIRFKLKVQAALDAKMDTLPEQKAELQAFRYQVAENYIRDEASINLLTREAFDRSLKDIHLSHIFIPVSRDASPDSIATAQERANEAYSRLQQGVPFAELASSYQHGSLGYVTAFVLPYRSESVAFSLKPGQYSAPFQSQSGFHILFSNGERKAVGKLRAAQILLAFPPDVTDEGKKKIAARADSIYNALQSGADFAEMARQYSDDHLTYYSGGEMPAFGVGQYDTVFEQAAFAIERDGEVAKPVKTAFGYHIIKRLQRVPVIDDAGNKEWMEVIRERVLQSDRMEAAQQMLIQNIQRIISKDAPTEALKNDSAAIDYYRNNLERYNPEFADQLNEFREGNLLFAIMQRKVWDAASEDSAGVRAYYQKNSNKYNWENSADALIVTSLVADSVESIQAALKHDYRRWREIVEAGNTLIQADSGRFELSQIPVVERTNFTEGLVTAPVINEPDSSRTFAYIIKMYTGSSPKSFADARGSVINDYQTYLEELWVADLKRKYPVKINRKVFAQVKEGKSPRS